ncbi:MAG: T9SS type B sorting domain-containing protein [Cloacibacterium sp.]|nr:T9SS type B sorting domain-containing protein [Cloacibacterium sp.]
MKSKFILVLTFLFQFCFGQLDTEHWFAPVSDKARNGNDFQSLFFSTNETTPFDVFIYNNNSQIGQVTISKGNPAKFRIYDRENIITINPSKLFTPTTMGLYCKAEKKFFANLRFSSTNHAEIITSKGKAGIGTKFYAAMAPITTSPSNPILNFTLGILATEDNTQVTISNYKSGVTFSNGSSDSSLTFTLNKGQSYLIDGSNEISQNWDGFIGAKITATKPISVTNGNMNGQYSGDYPRSSDILMDQSVPVERLGDEFVLVKGNGNIGSAMEAALVIATQNNTEIFINGSAIPYKILNEGEYVVVNDSNYINISGDHYNLYIKTSQPAYVYQLLAGAIGSSSQATGGMNYIPPLNCFLPQKIDEIGLIDENEGESNQGFTQNKPTKLNVISEKGAVISVNGVSPTAANGPFDVLGTSGWVTYSFPNITGNVTINSTKSITAGISAGNGAVGYGGFFAGFSSFPVISKKAGECNPGLVLEADSNYDTYQWMHNGVVIPGATTSEYTPTKSGYYSVKVTNGTCIEVVTPNYKVLNCPKNTTIIENICDTKNWTARFTSSHQSINFSSIIILNQPTKGNVVINSVDGKITYTVTAGSTGTDSFQYRFCGLDPEFPDCEIVTVNINIESIALQEAVLKSCSFAGLGTYNLSHANVNSVTNPLKYYPTLADAKNSNSSNEIVNITNYTSERKKIYVVATSSLGCKFISSINLEFIDLPKIDNIEITGSTITVHVSGATPPYRYSLDGRAYQDSPVFSQLNRGKHTISVLSSDNCEPVTKEFSIINIMNVITPNDDGYNDRLDYSDLSLKNKVVFKVFDRFGKLVFEGNSQNQFIWDGKYLGRVLPTDSYWYILEWTEPDSEIPLQFKSWILLKNRD